MLVLVLVWLAEAPLLIFLLLPPLLFSLAPVGDELARHSGEAGVVAFALARLVEDSAAFRSHWPPPLCLLTIELDALACPRRRDEAFVFDLADAMKALAQFEHSSVVVAFDFVASLEVTEQFEQATEVKEAFLIHCLRLHMDCFVVAFGHARAAALPSNMVDAGLRQMVSLVAGGCYEPSCDTLPQPLTLATCY